MSENNGTTLGQARCDRDSVRQRGKLRCHGLGIFLSRGEGRAASATLTGLSRKCFRGPIDLAGRAIDRTICGGGRVGRPMSCGHDFHGAPGEQSARQYCSSWNRPAMGIGGRLGGRRAAGDITFVAPAPSCVTPPPADHRGADERLPSASSLWHRVGQRVTSGGPLLDERHPGDSPVVTAGPTALVHFRCRSKNRAASFPADCGTPVCPPI